jgi:predicted DNA binding CopG/RHH family protein
MTKPPTGDDDTRHPSTGDMTVDEYAQWLEEHHDDEGWEPVDAETSANLTIVVSVRFNKDELSKIDAAAEAAGIPLSTYIRQAAMNAANASSAADELRQHLRALTESLRKSQEAAEHLARDVQLSRHRSEGSVAA